MLTPKNLKIGRVTDKRIINILNDLDWIEHNYPTISERYNKTYIAVKNKEIICSSKSEGNLEKKLNKLGISEEKVAIEFIDTNPPIYL